MMKAHDQAACHTGVSFKVSGSWGWISSRNENTKCYL